MSPAPDLAAFIEVVADDPSLVRQLAGENSDAAFSEKCASLAGQRGLRVAAGDVLALLRERALLWHQRCIL